MNSNDPFETHSPLRDVAANPEAMARYLADVQRVLLDIGRNLETLAMETRVHLRGTQVPGDRFYHARLRALPVERQLKAVLSHVNDLTDGLEKTAYKRKAFTDEVNKLPKLRKEKELAKARKKNPPLQPAQNPAGQQGVQQALGHDYSVPANIYDLGQNRESA